MLIQFDYIIKKFKLKINGILHVGAHECEELKTYVNHGLQPKNIYWLEAQTSKVIKMKNKNIDNIYQAIVDEIDGKTVYLNISNNSQSSSILEFGTHLKYHPQVKYIDRIIGTTTRIDTLIEKENIPIERLNFINLDIQGVELRALKSMEKYLHNIDYIYTEINTDYVYKNCNLVSEIDEYLNKFGFKRVLTKMAGNAGWGDAFYIKKNN